MLGFNKCLICGTKNEFNNHSALFRNGWYKLILKNENTCHKYTGWICPDCAENKAKPMFFRYKD